MAAALVSMSESLQTSMILQRQLNFKEISQPSTGQQCKGLGVFVQLLLVSALFGIELVIAFEQIYQILFHQFLGVPVSLLSVNGIVCGAISMTLLPILGYLSDRGANPKKRKLFSLFVGMTMFLSGLLLLGVGGFIKLQSLDAIVEKRHETKKASNTSATLTTAGTLTDNTLTSGSLITEFTSPTSISQNHIIETEDNSQLSATAYLSIIGFSLIDIGFDMSISITRAFILESTPAFQHTRLLVMATVVASTGGTAFSFLGCFDFPGALGSLFHVEGVAVTLIFFCTLLFCLVLLGYSSTIITGYSISQKKPEHDKAYTHKISSPKLSNEGTSSLSRRRIITAKEQVMKHSVDRPNVPDILHTEEGDSSKRPLLLDDSLRANNYMAMSLSTSSLYPPLDAQDTSFLSRKKVDDYVDTSVDNLSQENSDAVDKNKEPGYLEELDDADHKELPAENNTPSIHSVVQPLHSTSMTHTSLDDFHSRKLEHFQNNLSLDGKRKEKSFLNKRLVILCFSCFFTFGSLITFIIYISNALNIGIFHGDPTALPGTEAYDLYQSGLRTAALGNLVLYLTFMVISINNARLINLIGEKVQFLVCHVFLIASLLTLIITQRVEVYFVFMMCCGAFRTCVFTLPFVLATKFTQEETSQNTEENEVSVRKPNKNLGKVMSLIGFLIPTHYILVSSFMGPLMDATGSVWVPLIYSLCSCTISLIIFMPLFFING